MKQYEKYKDSDFERTLKNKVPRNFMNKVYKIITVLFLILILCNSLLGSEARKIHIFYSNDLQGGIGRQLATYMNPTFPPVLGGGPASYAIIQKVRERAKKSNDIVLLLDAGDFSNGITPISENSNGLAVIEYMNKMQYDALTFGSNDFNLGRENLLKMSQTAQFPFLASNLSIKDQNEIVKSYTIIERNGLKIGLFGIVSKAGEQNDNPEKIAGITFLSEIPAAQKSVDALKKEGVDLIIALAHLGLPYDPEEGYTVLKEQETLNLKKDSYINAMDLARYVSGIDVIISGQIHKGYQEPWEDPVNHTLCFQNYANGGNLGYVTINYDSEIQEVIGFNAPSKDGGLLLLSEDEYWPDREMKEFTDSLQKKYEPEYDIPIGTTLSTLSRNSKGQSPMSILMCQAMLDATNADFAFNNYVSMRADIPIGPVTPRAIASVFPFGNEIMVITMKGELLKELMEGSLSGGYSGFAIAGAKIKSDRSLPTQSRIISFNIYGKPLKEDSLYKVATTEYLAEGNYGLKKLAFLPEDSFNNSKIKVRDAVIMYLKKHKQLDIAVDNRWNQK